MSPPNSIHLVGTIVHVGTGAAWNRFDFLPSPSGDPIKLCHVNCFSAHGAGIDFSRGGFALLGIITAFPKCLVKLSIIRGPGEGGVFLELQPDHSHELPRELPSMPPPPLISEHLPPGGAVVQIQRIEFEDMPLYKFYAHIRDYDSRCVS